MYLCKEDSESKGKSLSEDNPINSNKNKTVNTGIFQGFDLFTKYGCDKGKGMIHSTDEGRAGKGIAGSYTPDTPETEYSDPLLSLFSSYDGACNTKDFLGQQYASASSIHVAAQPSHTQADLTEFYPLFRPAGSTFQCKHSYGAQLTICYGGSVNVYDDIPADKAQAIILLASGKSVQNENNYVLQSQCIKSDLPVARNHSLQRFLDKRHQRLNLKAPYLTEENPTRS